MELETYKNLSEASQYIYNRLKGDFDDEAIKEALEDGEALEKLGFDDDDQGAIEELHSVLQPH